MHPNRLALALLCAALCGTLSLSAQETVSRRPKTEAEKAEAERAAEAAQAAKAPKVVKATGPYTVEPGTHVPLALINSVSTKHATEGDRVYLETVFPVLVNGRIVIPPGSYVAGTITQVKRPGKVKGRGEFYLRFETLTLPNGVTRDFRARVSNLDGRASEELDRTEGTIRSEGNKAGDAKTIGETAAAGASVGAIAGSAAGGVGMGAGIGAAAGAAAGLIGVLMTRGPDAILSKGTTIEMVLDRPVLFDDADLDFSNSGPKRPLGEGSGPLPSRKLQQRAPGTGRFPF